MYCSVVWCSGGCCWKCYKTLIFWFCSLLTRCTIPCACHAKRHLNVQKWSEPLVFCTFWLRNVLRATTACIFSTSQPACTFSTSQLPKGVRTWCFLYILTSKCASCHNGVHFFDISTSKRGPNMVCFLYILTWKCASRHNDVQFFISHLRKLWLYGSYWFQAEDASLPHPKIDCWGVRSILWWAHHPCSEQHCQRGRRAFVFRRHSDHCRALHRTWRTPQGLQRRRWRPAGSAFSTLRSDKSLENIVFRDFPTFSRTWIFFLLRLSLLWSSFFFSSLLWLFPSLLFICLYCRSCSLKYIQIFTDTQLIWYYVIWCTINTFMGCAETERWSMIQSGFLFWTLCPGNLDLVSPVPFSINYTYSGMLDMSVISLLNFG